MELFEDTLKRMELLFDGFFINIMLNLNIYLQEEGKMFHPETNQDVEKI